jgi:hypothetical protein
MGGLSSGEGLVYPIRDPTTKVGKDGIEQVVDEGVQDKRLFIEEPEFSSVLKVATREGNTLTEYLRKAFDGKTLGVMTRNSPLRASSPHVSVLGHITKDELLRTLDSTDAANGFANRYPLFMVKRSKYLPEGGNVKPAERETLVRRTRSALEEARKIGQLTRDDAAKEIWHQVYETLAGERYGLFGAITARAEAHVLRFSAIYAALDGSRLITKEHLLAALALWKYAEDSARYLFGDATGDPIADRILAELRMNGPQTQTELSQLLGRNYPKERLHRATEVLLRNGLVVREVGDKPASGPAPIIWRAV